MRSVLLVFIKNPRPGYVKTRLAADVGDEKALEIYHFLLRKTRDVALQVDAERHLYYSDQIEIEDEWPSPPFVKKIQHRGDLGRRMCRAFEEAFESGANRVAIIGSDCPSLDGTLLSQALEQLEHTPVVLGPSTDGGYYLLAMRACYTELFEDIDWSTERVLQQTLARAKAAGLTYALLPALTDIDTLADWEKYYSATTRTETLPSPVVIRRK